MQRFPMTKRQVSQQYHSCLGDLPALQYMPGSTSTRVHAWQHAHFMKAWQAAKAAGASLYVPMTFRATLKERQGVYAAYSALLENRRAVEQPPGGGCGGGSGWVSRSSTKEQHGAVHHLTWRVLFRLACLLTCGKVWFV